MKKQTEVLTNLALFLCLGVVIGSLERFIPLGIPGAKIGLSNIVLMAVFVSFGVKEYISVGLLKVILTSLLFGGFGVSFILSLSGFVFSAAVVIVLSKLNNISIYTLSVAGAVFHILGQTLSATVIYKNIGMLYYLPILLCVCYLSGLIVGFLSKQIIKITKKVP